MSVLDRAVGLAGFTVANLTTTPLTQFKTKIAARLKTYWEKAWWPELTPVELRYFRDAYNGATTYAIGDEVYYAATDRYYTAIAGSTGNLPTNAIYWTATTELDAYISLDQTGLTAIGEVEGVYIDDPRIYREARRLPYVLNQNGVQVLGVNVPKSVYLRFRQRAPELLGADYAAATAYGSGVTRYYTSATAGYEGDFWTTTTATTAGDSPESQPTKWTRLEFPLFLRECTAHGAYADWLRLDGASDLAVIEDDQADAKLSTEIIKLAAQGQIARSRSA